MAGRKFSPGMFRAAFAVMELGSGKMLKHRQLINHEDLEISATWSTSLANEFGRLFQGVRKQMKSPTNTCHFIMKNQVPKDRFKDVTYGKFECTKRPQKAEKHRTRLIMVMEGNRINYLGEVGTPTAEMLLVKILLNSVISTRGAKFMSIVIKIFYLATPMERYGST